MIATQRTTIVIRSSNRVTGIVVGPVYGSGGESGPTLWGTILGVLSQQTDLNTVLASIQNAIAALQTAVAGKASSDDARFTTAANHFANTANPHSVTASQIGADPGGTASTLLSAHEAATNPHSQYATVSALLSGLSEKISNSAIGLAGGIASLGSDGFIPDAQIPAGIVRSSALSGYVTTIGLTSTLGGYVTTTALTSALSGNLAAARYQIGSSGPIIRADGAIEFRNSSDSGFHAVRTNEFIFVGPSGETSLFSLATDYRDVFLPDRPGTIALAEDTTAGLYDPVANLGSVSGAVSLNVANSGARLTIAGNTTFSFSGAVASGFVKGFLIQITNGGSAAIIWPTSIKWSGAIAPSFTVSGVDFITLWTIDGGTNWIGGISARDSR